MKQTHREWFLEELPKLEEEGILSQYYADTLREHYTVTEDENPKTSPLPIMLSILGALLVGGGVILLLGHNWSDLSRLTRTILVFLPLLASQLYVLFVLYRRIGLGARETAAALNVLMTAASIALIGQTYHIPGNLASFLFVWMVLTLPVVYIMRSLVAGLIYLVGISFWAGFARYDVSTIDLFWVLYAAGLPFFVRVILDQSARVRGALVGWAVALHAPFLQLFMDGDVAGILWVISYACLFAVMYGLGHVLLDRDYSANVPFRIVGSVGIVAIAVLMTFDDFIEDAFWYQWREFGVSAYLPDMLIVFALLVGALFLFVSYVRKKSWAVAAQTALPIFALICWAGVHGIDFGIGSIILMNVYAVAVGCILLAEGVKSQSLGWINKGMGVLTVLLVVRFFDSDLPMALRGVAFVFLGLCFWGVNMFVLRRQKRMGMLR